MAIWPGVNEFAKGKLLQFTFIANSFLYHMIRSIIGTLVDIGRGKKDILVINELLNKQNRKSIGKTFDAKGLCLYKVYY